MDKVWIIVSTFSVFLLSLMMPTNLYSYGQLAGEAEDNQSLVSKYGTPEQKLEDLKKRLKIEAERLTNECVENINIPDRSGGVSIYLEDKCKPVIDYYKSLGLEVTGVHESFYDRNKDVISLAIGSLAKGCLDERFETHVLLKDLVACRKTIEYYLANGYDFVDKYNEKVELIQRQNSSQVNP